MISGEEIASKMKHYYRWLIFIVVVWVMIWIWFMRYHYLDDALIYYREAKLLWRYKFLTFDGATKNFGITNLFFNAILALLLGMKDSIAILKIVSVIFYLLLLALIAWLVHNAKIPIKRYLCAALLIILISPMALRWFTDGMDTSLAVLVSAILAISIYYLVSNPVTSFPKYIIFVFFGTLIGLMRIDLIPIIIFASLSLWLSGLRQHSKNASFSNYMRQLTAIIMRESHIMIGCALAIILIYLLTGRILPDPAIAKSSSFAIHHFNGVIRAIVASFSLGMGLSLLWIISFFYAYKVSVQRKNLSSLLVANLVLPFAILLIVIRGQYMQGVRNLLYFFIFMVLWNIQVVSKSKVSQDKFMSMLIRPKARLILCLMIISLWLFEGRMVARIVKDRSRIFLDMLQQNLKVLRDEPFVAFDIGFISAFSEGKLCDMGGLVQGRDFAHKSIFERAEYCAAQSPSFAFITKSQAFFLNNYIPMSSWIICHKYSFSNVSTQEPHYLIVKPEIAAKIYCDEQKD